jgi:hypothetical protein
MKRQSKTSSLAEMRLMNRSSHTSTLGYALETFRESRDLSPAGLAAWLSLKPEKLPALAAERRPEPDESDFNMRCAAIAERAGCDAFALRILLRWLRASG